MAAGAKGGDDDQEAISVNNNRWVGKIQEEYRKMKENAETYPYVWGSYIVVYGGLGLWFAYRWRKLCKTEDRVRGLQEKLRKLVESQESGSSSVAATSKTQPPHDKPTG